MALGGAVLPGHPAGEPLTHSHHRDEAVDGRSPACRAPRFPDAISSNAAFPRSAPARSRFSVAFSFSSSFSFFASSASQPTELVPPPVVGLLRHLKLPADVGDVLTFAEQPVGMGDLADHLLRCVSSSLPSWVKPSCPDPARQDSQPTWLDQQWSRHRLSPSNRRPGPPVVGADTSANHDDACSS